MLIVEITFIAVLLLIVGAYWVAVVIPDNREKAALRRRLKSEPLAARHPVLLEKRVEPMSTIGPLDTVLAHVGGLSGPLKKSLEQSGLPLTVGRVILLSLVGFLAAVVAGNYLTHLWWPGLLAGLILAPAPMFVVAQAKARRLSKFEEQFPEAIELVARAMRAGHAFSTGLQMAADEMPAPVGTEFKVLHDRQNFGADLPDALRSFAERVPSLDARFFVIAVLTQREAGGNLSEVLDRLAAVMRERFKIRREVRVRSAHGRVTAFVLAGMPPAIAGMMFFTNPGQFKILLDDPLGVRMIIGAVLMQVAGTLVVRNMVNIEY